MAIVKKKALLKTQVTSYTFKVVLESDKWPDESDDRAVWRAYVPSLRGAHAWGDTPQQALEHLRDAVDLVIADMMERGEPIPTEPLEQRVNEPRITVNV